MSSVPGSGFEEAACEYKTKSGKTEVVRYRYRVNFLHPQTGAVYPACQLTAEQRKAAATGVLLSMADALADGYQAIAPEMPSLSSLIDGSD